MPVTQVDDGDWQYTIGDGRPGPVWTRLQQALEASTRKKEAVA
jgi:hypothetical protein